MSVSSLSKTNDGPGHSHVLARAPARTPMQEWTLALAAVTTQVHSSNLDNHQEIGGWSPLAETSRDWAQRTLMTEWAIRSRAELLEEIYRLRGDGDTALARALVDGLPDDARHDDVRMSVLRGHVEEIRRCGLVAWDSARLVTVAGWGVLAGYSDEDEFWGWTVPRARFVQSIYRSWNTYAGGYDLGRAFRCMGHDKPTATAIRTLLHDPRSPWCRLDWDTPLTPSP